MKGDVKNIDDLLAQIEELKNIRRLITHQIFTLMEVGRKITTSDNLSKQLNYIAKGIVDARLFKRAVISIFGGNWERINIGYAGFSPEEKKILRKNKPLSPSEWEQILSEKYRVSESYYIPHYDELNKKLNGIPVLNKEKPIYSDTDEMHPDDYLFVPLRSRDQRILGVISVDQPFDGKKPSRHSGTLRLLELFARLASSLIERNIMLNQIREKEAYLNNIIHSSADIIVSTDEKGKIKIFNPAAEKLFGYKAEEIIGKNVLELYLDPAQAREVMAKMRSGNGTVSGMEVLVVSKDKKIIPLSLSASILYDERGREIGTMGVSHDLTLQKELEKRNQEIAEHRAVSDTVKMLSRCITTQLVPQLALLLTLDATIRKSKSYKQIKNLINRIFARSCQIAKITKTLENPPAFSEKDEYWNKIKELALPIPDDITPEYRIPKNLKGVKVLVAEDDDVIRNGIAEFLSDLGMIVDAAEDGEVAIEKIKEKHSRNEMYDIVITDLNMPRKRGSEVFRFVKELNPNIPVILMPRYIDMAHEKPRHDIRDLPPEAICFNEKPHNMVKLLQDIERVLSGKNDPS